MTAYTLISSDSHIIEPADLWEQRIDRRFKDRAPRLVHEGELDQWYADGVKFGNIGTNQQAGLRFEAPEKLTAAGSMATIPRGGVDPHAHVQDMDLDSVAGGVFERYPALKVGAVEFEIAWAPYFMNRMDNVYSERAQGVAYHRFKNGVLPSDFFRQNVFISFQEDALGIQLRSYVGVENLMWGSDYPHAESTFPRSREIVDRILQDVPDEEKRKIVGDNVARLYHFN